MKPWPPSSTAIRKRWRRCMAEQKCFSLQKAPAKARIFRPKASQGTANHRERTAGCERMACARIFHPTAIHLVLERLIINKLQKQGWLWVLSEAPKSRVDFNNILIVNDLLKHQLDMGWKNMKVKSNFVSSSLFSSLCHPKYRFPGPRKRKFGASCILLNY